MLRTFLLGKLHKATITHTNLYYEGSVTIDSDLMDLIGLREFEKVAIWDISNGARIETYAIRGEAGSTQVQLNGGASHLMNVGDQVVIAYFGVRSIEDDEPVPDPKICVLDFHNRVIERR